MQIDVKAQAAVLVLPLNDGDAGTVQLLH